MCESGLHNLSSTERRCTSVGLWLHNKDADSLLFMAKELIERRRPASFLRWRDICRSTDERTVISNNIPTTPSSNTAPLMFSTESSINKAALSGNLNSIVYDYIARQKIGGTHLTCSYFKQFPTLEPRQYSEFDKSFIIPRILELNYTAYDMESYAEALDYFGAPFPFDPRRRHLLKSELDAYYAKLYGLTRDELRYILDPSDVMGPDYPSETFRVLKNKEIKEFGEYRTQRLVLEAWDKLEQKELEHETVTKPIMPGFVYPGDDPLQQTYCGLVLATIRQLSPVDKKFTFRITNTVLDKGHRETFLEEEKPLPLPSPLVANSTKYDFERAIKSLESQHLIRRSTGDSWIATEHKGDGTAIIPEGIGELIAQSLRVEKAIEAFNKESTTEPEQITTERKSS